MSSDIADFLANLGDGAPAQASRAASRPEAKARHRRIGAAIRHRREAYGWPLEVLAHRVHCHCLPESIAALEKGGGSRWVTGRKRERMYAKIAAVFGTTVRELEGDDACGVI